MQILLIVVMSISLALTLLLPAAMEIFNEPYVKRVATVSVIVYVCMRV